MTHLRSPFRTSTFSLSQNMVLVATDKLSCSLSTSIRSEDNQTTMPLYKVIVVWLFSDLMEVLSEHESLSVATKTMFCEREKVEILNINQQNDKSTQEY